MESREELIQRALQHGVRIDWYTEDMYDETPDERNVEKDEYSISDCILVRTTNVFPKNKVVQTPDNGNAYGFGSSSIFGDVVWSMIREKYPKVMTSEEEALFSAELSQYDVFFEICRSTIHYTLNGLVSSHMYGNFDDRACIVVDLLEEHIDDESLIGLRVEDTYFNDDMELSSRSTLMMPVESFKYAINNPEYLDTLSQFNRVVVFEGDAEKAVACLLHNLGSNAFLINNHGYVGGLDSRTEDWKMLKFISSLANSRGIPQERHCYSQVYQQDYSRKVEAAEKNDKNHLFYVLDQSDVPQKLDKQIRYECDCFRNFSLMEDSVTELVNTIGLDQLRVLTLRYNKECVDKVHAKINEGHKRL